MKKDDVVKHFGTQAAAAEALGITKQALTSWGPYLPEGVAYKCQVITGGRLIVNPKIYTRIKKNRMAVKPA